MNTEPTEAKPVRVETVHFGLDPAWLAAHVRELVQSEDWRHADRTLACLEDDNGPMPLGQRYSILKGETTLIGAVNRPEIVPWEDCEEKEEHLDWLTYKYAGICRDPSDASLWQAYAYVIGGNAEDAAFASHLYTSQRRDGCGVSQDWSRARSLYYADDIDADRAVHFGLDSVYVATRDPGMMQLTHPDTEPGPHATLWRRIVDPPPWIEFTSNRGDFKEAWKARIAAGFRPNRRGPARSVVTREEARTNSEDLKAGLRERAEGRRLRNVGRWEAEEQPEPEVEVRESHEEAILRLTALINARAESAVTAEIAGQSIPRALIAAYSIHALRHHLADGEAQTLARALWEPVSPVGFKRGGSAVMKIAADLGVEMPSMSATFDGKPMLDDPWHTDLVLAGGWDIGKEYERDEHPEVQERWSTIYDVEMRIQHLHRKRGIQAVQAWVRGPWELPGLDDLNDDTEAAGHVDVVPCVVLCGTGVVEGVVVQPAPDEEVVPGSIVVVPHAGPEHYIAAITAHRKGGAVIAETGGKLSHLAAVGLEEGFRVVVVGGALQLFPVGMRVRVDLNEGVVEILGGLS